MEFRLDRDYFELVLILEKLPVFGVTEKFCGGFPIAILTKYTYVSYMNEEYNANNNVLLFRISFDTDIFLQTYLIWHLLMGLEST